MSGAFDKEVRFDIIGTSGMVKINISHDNLAYSHLGERDLCVYDAKCFATLEEAMAEKRTDDGTLVIADESPYKVTNTCPLWLNSISQLSTLFRSVPPSVTLVVGPWHLQTLMDHRTRWGQRDT